MGMIEFEEVMPEEDYLLVKKIDVTETEGGLFIANSGLNLVDVLAGTPMELNTIGILAHPPEIDLQNGQFMTSKKNLIGKAKRKETK